MRLFASFIASLVSVAFAPAASAQSNAAAVWQVSTMSTGIQVVFIETPGTMRRMAMACQGGAPMLTLVVSLRSAQPRANLELTGTVGGRPVTVPMILSPKTGAWWTILRDRAALDLLAGASNTVSLTMGGARLGTIPLSGSSNAIRSALAGCYVPSASVAKATPAGIMSRAVFGDASLPPAVRRDLIDFDQSCSAPEPYTDRSPNGRGVGLAAPGVISRADFNSDGVEDFVLDTGKLRCSRAPKEDYSSGGSLFIYTSLADGSLVPSLDVPIDRFAIIAGKKATLRIHQKAVTDEIEGDNHPEINETLTMVSATRWSPSKVATLDWRLGALDKFPPEVKTYFGELDRRCAAAGRRLIGVEESISAQNVMEDEKENPIDFNADGVPDYVVDTANLNCGLFYVAPKTWTKPCGPNCVLVAFVSKPGGGYVVSPVPGFGSFNGNGDPDYLGKAGKRDVICKYHNSDDNGVITAIRYSWTGVTGQRAIVRRGQGCG